MPATNTTTHKFFEAKPRLAGKVGAGGVASDSATNIPHNFVGLTDGNAYVVTVNRTNATGTVKNSAADTETFVGVVSSTNFINCVREVEGAAQAWAADTVLEILVTAYGQNKLIEGIETEHNPDGTHSDITVDSINTHSVPAGTSTLVTLAATQTLTNKTLTAPQIGGDADLDDATGNITVQGADPKRTISIFGGMKPTTTTGCASKATVEAGTNDIDYDVLAFDASSDESAFVNFQMPESYDGGVVQFRYVWTNASGLTTETVQFELAGRSLANDEAIDQAVGTAVAVDDTWIAQGDVHISDWSGDVTLGGTPASSEWVHFEITRDVSDDNLTGDCRLMDVQIRYKQKQYSD